ncbi:MAG TPA: serine/threonine-protein kinase, partial [Polyangiaceae bacterium]|nr:serine/threonine-protein kinase [Polyangiaceae bacterium]
MSGTNTKSKTNPHMASEVDDTIGPGDEIGRYQLISRLASGGMGEVWTAKATGSGFARTVALKLVRSEMSGDENYARMFIDEATVASSIHHPNVCETYELGKHGDRLFMAMEWIAGDSLAGLLRQGDYLVALDVRIAARIIADACAGLHAAHETVGPDGASLGVVHRDISPPNILISMQGQAKVSDFGIAKARHQLHERTKTGEVKGKFAYIAPEQITGHPVDRRADVYAMGCVLYVATLGSRPFGNGADALRKILSNKYKSPR